MKSIGIMPNLLKDKDLEITQIVVKYLKEKGFELYAAKHIVKEVPDIPFGVNEGDIYKKCDMIIAIGGDGTILSVAQRAYGVDVPIIGINLGRVGFLADIEASNIISSLQKIIEQNYHIEERMMLKVKIIAPNGEESIFHALNEISITRGSHWGIVDFEILVNGHFCDVYPADGVIVSTPTGSTAYNLSAGGPIVVPHAKAYIVTPICPHTIYSRSIIMSQEDHIQVKIGDDEGMRVQLNIDNKMQMYLTSKHRIHIEKSPCVIRLVKLSEFNFFEILRKKIVERHK